MQYKITGGFSTKNREEATKKLRDVGIFKEASAPVVTQTPAVTQTIVKPVISKTPDKKKKTKTG